jgi:dephospho-CoA kinase
MMAESSRHPLRIGLTGGVATGKSAVAKLFAGLGATVIDTDVIAREVVEPGQPGLAAVRDAFGAEVLQSDGSLDRKKLRELVFADPTRKAELENILHPLIREATLAAAANTADSASYQILVVPLLLESGFDALVDRILVVDCPTELQQERLMDRDATSAKTAANMIAAQADRAERLAHADDIIDNSGSIEDLEPVVRELHRQYLELAD